MIAKATVTTRQEGIDMSNDKERQDKREVVTRYAVFKKHGGLGDWWGNRETALSDAHPSNGDVLVQCDFDASTGEALTIPIMATVKESLTVQEPQATLRHKKRGSTYRVIAETNLQTDVLLNDDAKVTIYQDVDSEEYWVRATREMGDGRFEELPTVKESLTVQEPE